VLLADAKSAAYVGRPVVFYLGLDEDWTHSSPRRPWVDRDQEYERNIRQFQLLLQNGVDQYYLVQDTAGGTPVTPCLYFEEILDEEFERFSDLDSIQHSRAARTTHDGFGKESIDVAAEKVTAFSQSSLNTYVNSPRDYFFSRLLETPDKDYFREGNLFHDFAEFYVTHPDVIRSDDLDEIAEVILDDVDPFLRGVDREVRLTKYRIGLQTVVEFLDANPPADGSFLTPASGWGRTSSRNTTTDRSTPPHRTLVREHRPRAQGEGRPRIRADPPARLQERDEEVGDIDSEALRTRPAERQAKLPGVAISHTAPNGVPR